MCVYLSITLWCGSLTLSMRYFTVVRRHSTLMVNIAEIKIHDEHTTNNKKCVSMLLWQTFEYDWTGMSGRCRLMCSNNAHHTQRSLCGCCYLALATLFRCRCFCDDGAVCCCVFVCVVCRRERVDRFGRSRSCRLCANRRPPTKTNLRVCAIHRAHVWICEYVCVSVRALLLLPPRMTHNVLCAKFCNGRQLASHILKTIRIVR